MGKIVRGVKGKVDIVNLKGKSNKKSRNWEK